MSEPLRLEARRPTGFGRALGALALSLTLAVLGIGYSVLYVDSDPLEPAGLASRFVGLAAALRALISLYDSWPLLRLSLARRAVVLELSDDALTLRGWGETRRAAKRNIAAVVETAHDGVWLLLRGKPGPRALRLPPVFDTDEGALAERLMREIPALDSERERPESPPGLPSLRYDAAARGAPSVGTLPLRHGLRWARRGPYAALLFAVTLGSRLLSAPGRFELGPLFSGLLLVCVAVPVLWLLAVRRIVRPRKGLALLLTPEELLLRTRGGVVRTPYSALGGVQIERSGSWTLLEGSRPLQKLLLERGDDLPIRFDASFFRWPAEVVQASIEAYRRGSLP